jgi:MYXO-CTERM domain-containing protein
MRTPSKASWTLALIVPILASVAAWVWMSATISEQACATGQPAAGPGVAGLVLLVLAGPIAIGWQAWRARASLARTVVAIVASTTLAVPLILLTLDVCWVSHGCYT